MLYNILVPVGSVLASRLRIFVGGTEEPKAFGVVLVDLLTLDHRIVVRLDALLWVFEVQRLSEFD